MSTPTPGAPDAIVSPNGPFGFAVHPNVVWKHPGTVFTILNATGVTIHVSFPVLSTNPPEADVAPFGRQDFIINPAAPGAYDYQVWIKSVTRELIGFDLRASGGSDPRIIID